MRPRSAVLFEPMTATRMSRRFLLPSDSLHGPIYDAHHFPRQVRGLAIHLVS